MTENALHFGVLPGHEPFSEIVDEVRMVQLQAICFLPSWVISLLDITLLLAQISGTRVAGSNVRETCSVLCLL